MPWRLPRESTDLTTCFVGVSFYKSLDKSALLTSVAQVFNERGEGVVVRGRAANISKGDRQPHLPQEHAYELLKDALARYWDVHRTFPARVVVHKSSRTIRMSKTALRVPSRRKAYRPTTSFGYRIHLPSCTERESIHHCEEPC